jgi:predicted Zn-dependent protease
MRNLVLLVLLTIGVYLLLSLTRRGFGEASGWAGRQLRSSFLRWKWLYEHLGGSDEEAARAEEEIGAEMARELLADMPLDPNPEIQNLIRGIGERLAAAGPAKKRNYRFHAVVSSTANAHALPGGYIFVTRPLIEACERRPEELAFILGHEMAHVLFRHAADKKLLRTLLAAVRAGGPVATLLDKGYSRDHEREADRRALELMSEAGFERMAAVRVLQRLAALSAESGPVEQYFSTHPEPGERIEEITRLATT